tara:strand:- start:604 stop:786 length:183 start_codon:yes stop_codon:yes gene_type:complete
MKTTINRNGDGYSVYLLGRPDRHGFCDANCKGLFSTHAEALAEAERVAKLYRTEIEDKTK